MPSAIIGLIFHWFGGMAAASFYVPLKFIRRWPWESFYLVMGLFAWLASPWVIGYLTVPNLGEVLRGAPPSALAWTFLFGLLWGGHLRPHHALPWPRTRHVGVARFQRTLRHPRAAAL